MRSAKTDQTARMRRLIRVFSGHTSLIVGFAVRRLFYFKYHLLMFKPCNLKFKSFSLQLCGYNCMDYLYRTSVGIIVWIILLRYFLN